VRQLQAYQIRGGEERIMTIPQLRVRTEFSFRQAFGQVGKVVAALKDIGCPAAAIVDGGTWGHPKFAKECAKQGVRPMFGSEFVIPQDDGRKPVAWALAEDTRQFYNFSTAARQEGADIYSLFAEAKGVIRFAGAALLDPELFDYIDLNPASKLQQMRAMQLHKRTGKPLVITSDNAYPAPKDYAAFMAIISRNKETPQHILLMEEMWESLKGMLTWDQFAEAVDNTHEVAARCASVLPTAPIIKVEGDLRELATAGKQIRLELGHIKEWTPEYEARLQRELKMIAEKQYESYFIVVADLVSWAKRRMLVGPARGSSAGSLVCYLLRITEVDPLPHELLFERFIDVSRSDLPDIDIDFNDQKRELIFDYLAEKYGRANVARIGNVNMLKPRSLLAEACKRFGIPDHDRFNLVNVLENHSSGSSLFGKGLDHALTTTDIGKDFARRYPAAKVIGEAENHAWHTGVHAAGVIVCNDPISDYCTVGADSVAHIDKPDSEALNLLKIDALGLRTLGVLEDSGVVTNELLYALTLDDPEVLDIFNQQKYSGIFQFEGHAQRSVATEIDVNSFSRIDHITALARPGPLGGGAAAHYINRAAGREEVTFRHPSMAEYLSQTMGVVLYQETVMRICFEMGKFNWAVVSEIRKAMSASKGVEYFNRRGAEFLEGATSQGIPEADARLIWDEICTFGAWGMNKSHTVSYSIISYWCAWMKRYHPLEYAASCLRNAKDDDQALEILREITSEGIEYTPFDIDQSEVNWSVKDGRLLGGFMNLVGVGPAKATAAIEARRTGKIDREKFGKMEMKFADLYPLSSKYADLYNDPEKYGCRAGSRVLKANQFPDQGGDVLYLGKLIKKKPRDHNEAVLISKRRGKVYSGPTAFADFTLQDDSGIPIICRVDRYEFEPLGRVALDKVVVDEDVILIRGRRIPNFPMIKVERMKVMNRDVDLK
jgi:DNA-directed DNA polymerase III PolC